MIKKDFPILYTYEFTPSRWTFQNTTIRNWLLKILTRDDISSILFPYAGMTRFKLPNKEETYIDLNIEMPKPCIIGDCVEIMTTFIEQRKTYDCIVIDPPFSGEQAMRKYKMKLRHTPSLIKDLTWKLDPKHVVWFGYNSQGMCKKREFHHKEILLVNTGGNANDIICTWDIRSNKNLEEFI